MVSYNTQPWYTQGTRISTAYDELLYAIVHGIAQCSLSAYYLHIGQCVLEQVIYQIPVVSSITFLARLVAGYS